MSEEAEFKQAFNALAQQVYSTARDKGFWENRQPESVGTQAKFMSPSQLSRWDTLIRAEALALMITELSEAIEALRHGNPPDDKIPNFSALEAELADCIIRIMDLAHAQNLRVAEAVVQKMRMNQGRGSMHGKAF